MNFQVQVKRAISRCHSQAKNERGNKKIEAAAEKEKIYHYYMENKPFSFIYFSLVELQRFNEDKLNRRDKSIPSQANHH